MSSPSPLTKKLPLGVDPAIQKTIDAVQEVALNENVPTIIYPQNLAQPVPQPPAASLSPPSPLQQPQKARGPKPAPVKRFSVDLPVYAIEQIRRMSFDNKSTKRQVVLGILRTGGLTLKDVDLTEPDVDE